MSISRDNNTARDWFSPGRFAMLLGLLIAVSFHDVLFGGQCFVIRDFGLYGYPLAWYHHQSFWRGEIPLWDPLSCCGVPFLAQLNTITLYPLSLIYVLLPMPWSLPFFCLVHQFLAGLGMYFLARRWTGSNMAAAVAGIIMAFNGLTLNFLMCPNYIACFAWMPWVVLTAETAWCKGGRYIVFAALAAAMQILAGGPETILFTWVILAGLAVIHFLKKDVVRHSLLLRFIAIGMIAGALSAAQLLPFLDLLAHSHRDKNFAASDWAMPSWGWGNFLLPIFNGSTWDNLVVQPGQFWTTSYYAGVACMALAAVALWRERNWRVWFIGLVFLVSIVLALGDNGFVYAWLRKVFPAIGFARYPVKFTVVTLWALPLLAAFGWRYFENLATGAKSYSRYVFTGLFAAAILLMLYSSKTHPMEEGLYPAIQQNAICRLIFLAATLAILHFFLTRVPWRKWITLSLLLLIWLDLLSHMPWQNPAVDPSIYDPAIARAELQLNPEPALGESRLMISPSAMYQLYYKILPDLKDDYLLHRVVFMSNCNLIDGLPKADGMFPLYLRDMHQILNPITMSSTNLDQLEDLMSVSQTIAPGKIFDWMPRTNYLPMISIGQKPIFADDQTTLNALMHETVNLHENVYLPKEAESLVTAKEKTTARISEKKFTAQKISLTTEASAATMLFVSQAYYHHWKAYVDEKPVPLWRANYAFQAVAIPSGQHSVKIIYEDKPFAIGSAFSLTALFGCGFALLKYNRRRKTALISELAK